MNEEYDFIKYILLMNILFSDLAVIDHIEVNVLHEEFQYEKDIQLIIDQLWLQKVHEASIIGSKLWDGMNYYLISYQIQHRVLYLTMGLVRYRNIGLYYCLDDDMKNRIKYHKPGGVFVAGIVKTVDGFYVFPTRGSNDVTKITGAITTFGGVLQPDDAIVTTFDDIISHMNQEMVEELGVGNDQIIATTFLGITESKGFNRGIVFLVELGISRVDAQQCFDTHSDGELDQLLFVAEGEVISRLYDQGYHNAIVINNLGLYRQLLEKTF